MKFLDKTSNIELRRLKSPRYSATKARAQKFGKSLETGPMRTQPDTVGPNEQLGRQSLAIIWFSCRELLKITGYCGALQLPGQEELSP